MNVTRLFHAPIPTGLSGALAPNIGIHDRMTAIIALFESHRGSNPPGHCDHSYSASASPCVNSLTPGKAGRRVDGICIAGEYMPETRRFGQWMRPGGVMVVGGRTEQIPSDPTNPFYFMQSEQLPMQSRVMSLSVDPCNDIRRDGSMLKFLLFFGISLGMTGCMTNELPMEYTWKRKEATHTTVNAPENIDTSLKSAKESCYQQSLNVAIPPQACVANPSRACWGTDYATGACPPQLPEDTVCNTEKVEIAMKDRDAAFISCMQDKGWALTVSPESPEHDP